MTETKNDELKPCPFCGDIEPMIQMDTHRGDNKVCYLCSGCSSKTGYFQTIEEVRAAWNRRPEPQRLFGCGERLE